MRIVHNGRYIEIPNPSMEYVEFTKTPNCNHLVVYYGNPSMALKMMSHEKIHYSTQIVSPYFHLIEEMLHHDVLDPKILTLVNGQIIPDIRKHFDDHRIVRYINRDVLFFTPQCLISRHTITELNLQYTNMTNRDIDGFTNLKKLNISETMIDLSFIDFTHPWVETLEEIIAIDSLVSLHDNIQHLRNLRTLDVTRMKNFTLDFITANHPMTKSLREMTITIISNDVLKHFRNLESLHINFGSDLSFVTSDHPWVETMTSLGVDESVTDDILCRFRKLRVLHIWGENKTLSFLNENHPLCDTLEELFLAVSNVKDDAIQHLRKLRVLSAISATEITLSFLDEVHPLCDTLEVISADDIGVTDDGVQYLRKLIKLNAPNVSLGFLGSNKNHPLCLTIQDIFNSSGAIVDDSIKNLCNLKQLIVYGNSVNLSFLTVDHPMAFSLEHLSMNNSSITDSALQHLQNLSYLETKNNHYITLGFLHEKHPLCLTLKELSTSCSSITDSSLRYLRRLQILDKWDGDIKLEFLNNPYHPMCFTLKELYIVQDENCDTVLQNLRVLEDLILDSSHTTLGFLEKFFHPMNFTLKKLNICDKMINDRSLRYLRALKKIRNRSEGGPSGKFLLTYNCGSLCDSLEDIKFSQSVDRMKYKFLVSLMRINGERVRTDRQT